MKFWIKFLHLFGGRLTLALVRNDEMATHLRFAGARVERFPGVGGFVTLHVGVFFLNVDWV